MESKHKIKPEMVGRSDSMRTSIFHRRVVRESDRVVNCEVGERPPYGTFSDQDGGKTV